MAKKTSVKMLAVITGVALALPPGPTFGQFLRLGPFDFDAQTFLEAIYTTNVEQERPSDATADREDFYLVWGLDLKSTAQFFPRTTVSLDTGIAIEKHFNRSDLDNSRAPFGRVIGRFDTDWDPIKLYGGVRYERTSESVDDKFIPAGKPKKRRQVGTKLEYLAGTDYIGRYVDVGTYYSLLQERYDSFDFFEEESDEATWFYYGRIKLTEKIRLGYEVERTKTDFVNLPDGEGDWEKTEKILLDFTQILFERPKVTYSVGLLREYDDEGETEGWEWTHTINVSDEWDISPTLNLKGFATYTYEEVPDDDDVSFQYGATLTHQISNRAIHSFTATRQPVDTLGSTEDTKETAYLYQLKIDDFLLRDLSAIGSFSYSISEPVDGETERIRIYTAGLTHTVQLNPRLTRKLSYLYTRESSNLEFEILDEHRVTLAFVLQL